MSKYANYNLFIGLNDKDKKVQTIPTEAALALVQSEVAKRFDGGTVYQANGIYRHENGDVVIEKTIKVEITFYGEDDNASIRDFCNWVKLVLNQESVAVQKSWIESELY